ncbi:MAG: trigger factor [Lactovum sp.]
MTATFEKTGATSGILKFSIDQDLKKKGLDAAFNKQKGKITVPGFRKGKITRQMFNRMFGEEALYENAVNEVLEDAYRKALEEVEVTVVAQPKIEVVSLEKDKDWELTAELVTKPEVKLGDYKELTVTVDVEKEVKEEDIEARLTAAQNRMAELVVKETEAENGDTVVIDFVGSVDAVEFDGGKGNNHSLELGSGQFIPGFEEQLVGHKAEDEVEVNVTFPENYQSEDLAGKDALFITKIHEVKTKEVPELDDELAKDIDDSVENLEELKAKYKEELEKSKAAEYKDAVEAASIDAAVENATIDEIPEAMLHEETHRAMNEFLSGIQQQGITAEMYYQFTGTTEEQMHAQYEKEAESRVKTNLVIEAIMAAEEFEITEEEVAAEAENLAGQYNMPLEQIQSLLPTSMLEHDIKMKKAVDLITETSIVKKSSK